ncbi:transposase, partial [Weissella muntiaci]
NVIVFNQTDCLEDAINQLKSLRDKTTWLNGNSKRISTMNNQIRFLNIKRNNILDEEYKQLAHQLLDNNNVVVLENLDSKDMRSVKRTNKAANRKLAKVKPYALQSFITSLANKTGKTLVKVDAYKTSQVEYGTEFEQKHKLDEKIELSNGEIVRGWKSLTGDNSIVIRDLNAAKNILAWGVNPEKHIKLKDYPNLKPSSLVSVN